MPALLVQRARMLLHLRTVPYKQVRYRASMLRRIRVISDAWRRRCRCAVAACGSSGSGWSCQNSKECTLSSGGGTAACSVDCNPAPLLLYGVPYVDRR
jgi:hypothetical protein